MSENRRPTWEELEVFRLRERRHRKWALQQLMRQWHNFDRACGRLHEYEERHRQDYEACNRLGARIQAAEEEARSAEATAERERERAERAERDKAVLEGANREHHARIDALEGCLRDMLAASPRECHCAACTKARALLAQAPRASGEEEKR